LEEEPDLGTFHLLSSKDSISAVEILFLFKRSGSVRVISQDKVTLWERIYHINDRHLLTTSGKLGSYSAIYYWNCNGN
jgi:hypothetical protein